MGACGLRDLQDPAVCAVNDLVVYAVVLCFVGGLNGVDGVAYDLSVGAHGLDALDKGGVLGLEGALVHHGNTVDAYGEYDIFGLCALYRVGDGDLKTGLGVDYGGKALIEQRQRAAGRGPDLGTGEHVVGLEPVGGAVTDKDQAGDVILAGVGGLAEHGRLHLGRGLGAVVGHVGSLAPADIIGGLRLVRVISAAGAQQTYAQAQSQCNEKHIAQFNFHL